MVRVVVLAAVVSACFDKPPRPQGTSDGSPGGDGAGSSACPDGQQPMMFEAFDEFAVIGTSACGQAGGGVTGSVTGGASLERSAGVLTYTGVASGPAGASCTWNSLPVQHGVILQWTVLSVIDGADTTTLTATWTASTSRTTGLILMFGPQLNFTSNGVNRRYTKIDYGQTWWRIAPDSTTGMGGWYSSDGSTWTSAGTDPGSAPIALAALTLSFESADANQLKLDTIYLCP